MAKAVRNLVVQEKQSVTPNLTRMILQGQALSDFPAGFEGGYVKLSLPDNNTKNVVRSYIIRRHPIRIDPRHGSPRRHGARSNLGKSRHSW